MKTLPLVLRVAPVWVALGCCLVSPVLRAEETSGKLSKAKEKYDTDKDGQLSAEEKAKAREDRAAKTEASEAARQKEVLAKYDADGNGQIDDKEKARMKSDEDQRREKYRESLAKYDANRNGVLDRDELAKMREDELLAARTARQAAEGDAKFQRKMQKMRGQDVPKVRKH
jgi:Ca2+-binding EF-hand superfamily protein